MKQNPPPRFTSAELSWMLYDVANSAFILLVSTTIPLFFASLVREAGMEPSTASGLWGLATAGSVLALAVLSPILGAVADYQGMKLRLFAGFLALGLLGAVGLAFAPDWLWFLGIFAAARLGYSACNVFYDSMLTDVASDERMDLLSSYGYAWGYLGSCIPFVLGVAALFAAGMSARGFRFSFLLTAVWWALLSIPLLKNVRQTHCLPGRPGGPRAVFRQVGRTFRKIRQDKRLCFFMLGYFCYIDGVYTIISMATSYGSELGIDSVQMILALLLTQLVAFPCAIASGRLAKRYGPLRLIKLFILVYIGVCIFGYQLDRVWEFWVLAIAVGACQGGIQALSRSYYGRLIPKEESNEFFGFFDIFGKFADFIGPLIVSFCALALGSSSYGILALAVLFAAGYCLVRLSERQGPPG